MKLWLYKKKKKRDLLLSLYVLRGKAMWGHRGKVVVYRAGREPSPGTGLAGTLTLGFWLPEL